MTQKPLFGAFKDNEHSVLATSEPPVLNPKNKLSEAVGFVFFGLGLIVLGAYGFASKFAIENFRAPTKKR